MTDLLGGATTKVCAPLPIFLLLLSEATLDKLAALAVSHETGATRQKPIAAGTAEAEVLRIINAAGSDCNNVVNRGRPVGSERCKQVCIAVLASCIVTLKDLSPNLVMNSHKAPNTRIKPRRERRLLE